MLARHTLLRNSPILKLFLTCESPSEFEQVKQNPTQYKESSSIAVSSLKSLHLHDTFSYLYTSLKSKLWSPEEPADLQSEVKLEETNKRIIEYLPCIESIINSLQISVKLMTEQMHAMQEVAKHFGEITEEDSEFTKTFENVYDYFMKKENMIRGNIKMEMKLIDEVKEEKLKLVGMKTAIAERKTVNLYFIAKPSVEHCELLYAVRISKNENFWKVIPSNTIINKVKIWKK